MKPPVILNLSETAPHRSSVHAVPRARQSRRSAIVIGGGIHGVTAAIELAKAGCKVTIVEQHEHILMGSSASTHNRAHLGCHYPRSYETARECFEGLEFFRRSYGAALYQPRQAYYAIEQDSAVSAQHYRTFLQDVGISFSERWPSSDLMSRDRLVASYLVQEPCFDLPVMRHLLREELRRNSIDLLTGWNVCGASEHDDLHVIDIESKGYKRPLSADMVVNATYTYANNVLATCNLSEDRTPYRYHTTEVVVVANDGLQMPAMTVMDGPFTSIMPLAQERNLMLLYDVVLSVVDQHDGVTYDVPRNLTSNWIPMQDKAARYFPHIRKLGYVKSLWGSRPVPINDVNRSRETKIQSHDSRPGFYTILEGKFISAPLMAKRLVKTIKTEQLL